MTHSFTKAIAAALLGVAAIALPAPALADLPTGAPTISDAPANGQWAANTTWYYMHHKTGGYVSTSYTSDGNFTLNASTNNPATGFDGQWCVVGSEAEGFTFYNRAAGPDHIFGVTGSEANARTTLYATGAAPETATTLFTLTSTQVNPDENWVAVKRFGTENDYLNSRDGYLALWNNSGATSSTNGPGSAIKFEPANEVMQSTIETARSTAQNIIDNYSNDQILKVGTTELTALQTALNASQDNPLTYATNLWQAISNAKPMIPDNTYVTIEGNGRGGKMFYANTGTGKVAGKAELETASVWAIRQSSTGDYMLYNPATNKYCSPFPTVNEGNNNDEAYVKLVELAEAGAYCIDKSASHAGFYNIFPFRGSSNGIHMSGAGAMVRWSISDASSQFAIEPFEGTVISSSLYDMDGTTLLQQVYKNYVFMPGEATTINEADLEIMSRTDNHIDFKLSSSINLPLSDATFIRRNNNADEEQDNADSNPKWCYKIKFTTQSGIDIILENIATNNNMQRTDNGAACIISGNTSGNYKVYTTAPGWAVEAYSFSATAGSSGNETNVTSGSQTWTINDEAQTLEVICPVSESTVAGFSIPQGDAKTIKATDFRVTLKPTVEVTLNVPGYDSDASAFSLSGTGMIGHQPTLSMVSEITSEYFTPDGLVQTDDMIISDTNHTFTMSGEWTLPIEFNHVYRIRNKELTNANRNLAYSKESGTIRSNLSNGASDFTPERLWYFKKVAGTAYPTVTLHTLALGDDQGFTLENNNNGAASSFSTTPTQFEITVNNTSCFSLRSTSAANSHLNDYEGSGTITYWNNGSSKNDEGSRLKVFEIEDSEIDALTKSFTVTVEPEMPDRVGGSSYTHTLSDAEKAAAKATKSVESFRMLFEGPASPVFEQVANINKLFRITFNRPWVSDNISHGTITASGYVDADGNVITFDENNSEAPRLATMEAKSAYNANQFFMLEPDGEYYTLKSLNHGTYFGTPNGSDNTYMAVERQHGARIKFESHSSIPTLWLAHLNVTDENAYLNASTHSKDIFRYKNALTDLGNRLIIEQVNTIDLDVTAEEYTSICYPFAVELPAALTAYIATEGQTDDNGTHYLRIQELGSNIVEANEAVLIAGTAGTYNLKIVYDGDDEPEPEPVVKEKVWLDRTAWTADASSQTEDSDDATVYAPGKAFDNDNSTFWAGSWENAPLASVGYQVFHINLGATEDVDGFSYLNRQTGSWDVIGNYEVYVTDEEVARTTEGSHTSYDFTNLTPAHSGTMERKSGEQTIDFTATATGRHFYLKVTSAYNDATNSTKTFSIAEINLYAMKAQVVEPEPAARAPRAAANILTGITAERHGVAEGSHFVLTGTEMVKNTAEQTTLPANSAVLATASLTKEAHKNAASLSLTKTDIVTSITDITTDGDHAGAQWYTLQGVRVAAPAAGGIYIRRTATGSQKVLVK